MRAIERTAIESGSVSGLALMERAAAAVVAAIGARWPGGRILVLCGPGNNGGDGFAIARLLAGQGRAVDLCFWGTVERLPADARVMHDRWAALGRVRPLGEAPGLSGGAGLIVDALFGTGLGRDLPEGVLAAMAGLAAVPVVAVDIPSGLCADSGIVRGGALPAALTVAFHAAKTGHLLGQGPALCGELEVADIGLPLAPGVPLVGPPGALVAKRGGHKYDHGHALVLTGGMGQTGAARLAARAALRIGAGLVTLGAPGSAMLECAAQITALMLRRVAGAEDLAALLADPRVKALCLGPGMGVERAAALLAVVGDGGVKPHPAAVLDADALTALGPVAAPLPAGWVLTPHGGEFARLFPDLAARAPGPGWSKIDAARAAAARAGCVVLLKGPDTVIAAPDGRAALHAAAGARSVPWLATAGAGDVLAGLIAGLLARGVSPFEAAQAAAWLHVEAALAVGPGLIAEDLPEALPGVLRALR